ncbi:MAG TPA: class I SAM-dependent methyltransferase [Acidimicrobiales bacterium]|nr:class I SAM-dependent methyltransferase [Acidimicrobiales bacterium]
MTSFFGSPDGDDDLENLNQEFWRSLLGHIRSGCPIDEVHSILDVGCNRGGLLELLARHFKPEVLFGLEPMADARQCATFRLKGSAAEVKILRPARWPTIPTASVDLVTAHEVLYLISDISSFMSSLARVIRPGGWAFVVLGCHTENPVWQRWKSQIEELGHETYDYSPMDVVRVASAAGFHTSVRPLRRDGWVIYDPATAEFQYSTVAEMFDHQYRQKLLFRLAKGKATARS